MTSKREHDGRRAFLLTPGSRYAIEESLVIGRAEDADLTLDSSEASRHHARIVSADGLGYLLEDLDSKNGTYLNGALLSEPAQLGDGDSVFLAGITFRFLSPDSETATGESSMASIEPLSIQLVGERLSIGRATANDVTLDDPNVSRFHAELVRADGEVQLRDLASRNGTYLDGQAVEEQLLPPGAVVRIGPYRLIYDGERVLARDERALLRLDAEKVGFAVKDKQILAETSLSIMPGELTAIIGESGAGKTTLLRLLAGVRGPTSGTVSLGGEPILGRTTDIAYAPQQEIVHTALSVEEALGYAARLRLPADTTPEEVEGRIEETLAELALEAHRHTRIGELSGGQRRRVGLAVELLPRPSLLCLDEPTTGLDPMLETQAMSLFRELATETRSVVLVTHATQNLGLCDRLVVMGRGGRLAFSGTPAQALEFFGVESFDKLYSALASRPALEWSRRYRAKHVEGAAALPTPESPVTAQPARPRAALRRQAAILTGRYLRTFGRDRRNVLILFGQVLLTALALIVLFQGDVFSRAAGTPNDAATLLFLMVTMSIWFGLFDATRELIKDRDVFLRERAVGVRAGSYLLSKLGLLLVVSALQIGLLCALVFAAIPLHEEPATYAGLVACLLLTGLAAVSLGLLTSAFVTSESQAVSLVFVLLVPQLLFAGSFIPLARMTALAADFANLIFAKWSFALAGTLIDMNQRIALDPQIAEASKYGSDFFAASLPLSYAVLAGFALVFSCAAAALLARRSA